MRTKETLLHSSEIKSTRFPLQVKRKWLPPERLDSSNQLADATILGYDNLIFPFVGVFAGVAVAVGVLAVEVVAGFCS